VVEIPAIIAKRTMNEPNAIIFIGLGILWDT